MRPLIVGLTGGIGSGKTAASDHFARLGVSVVDADVVAREVIDPGMPALRAIAEHFGLQVLNADGSLNRAALRSIVFADADERRWLEQLTHPLIRERILAQVAAAPSSYVVLVSPLLLETDQHQLVQRILLIDAPEQLQVARTMQRDNNSREQVEAILQAQSARAFKQQRADDIIVNDGDLTQLQQAVERLHLTYCKLAEQSHD